MIIFSAHAKSRLKHRHIPKQWVIETISQPDTKNLSFKNRRLFRRRYGDKILEVVTIQEDVKTIIVTQYWL